MSHLLNEVDDGTELVVTEIVKAGTQDIDVGDTFEIYDSRESGLLPDGSVPSCRWIATVEHEMPNQLGRAQLKSVNDDYSLVIVPSCMGGSRVQVEVAE